MTFVFWLLVYLGIAPWASRWVIQTLKDRPTVGNFVFYGIFWGIAVPYLAGLTACDKLERKYFKHANKKLEKWLTK